MTTHLEALRASLLLALVPLAACGGNAEPPGAAPGADAPAAGSPDREEAGAPVPEDEPAPLEPRPIDPATTGAVRGVVRWSGEPPPVRVLEDVPEQPGCHEGHDEPPLSEYFVVRDGRIQNVVVHVRSGLEGWIAPERPPREAELVQRGCIYRPHVLAMRTGDTLRVVNADPTNHNVNARARKNPAFNRNQAPGGADIVVVMEEEEIVPLRCDIHPWMSAHVAVFEHPFHAVTDAEGRFSIEGLPPGTYELEAVHPDNSKIGKRGKLRATVTVTTGETSETELVF